MKRLRDWYERDFLRIDFAVVTILYLGILAVLEKTRGLELLSADAADVKSNLYSATFSMAGCLLGFIISAYSVVLAFGELPRFKLLRDSGKHYAMAVVYFNSMRWLTILTAAAVAALFVDSAKHQVTAMIYVVGYFAAICSLRVYRCIWILNKMTFFAVQQPTAEEQRRNAA